MRQWQVIGCAAAGAPYVLAALSATIEQDISDEARRQRLAAAFLDPACAGGRSMSEATRAELVMLSQPRPPAAGPAR